jgi:serine/threonine-protein kinase RsbW
LRLAMCLPRQAPSVAKARRTLDNALAGIGVGKPCRDDIALALSEASSNAVEHALIGQEYDVVVVVGRNRCVVEVVDYGVGADMLGPDGPMITVSAIRGRGLHLIRAVTDGLEMRRLTPHGLAVSMIKTLTWARGAPSVPDGNGHEPWAVVQAGNGIDVLPTSAMLWAAEGF